MLEICTESIDESLILLNSLNRLNVFECKDVKLSSSQFRGKARDLNFFALFTSDLFNFVALRFE